ncbi:hypothetical protein OG618_35810 [Kitasatospora sp. NBC_01246]|uniref:hypothetical protein n=1 Tax=Kitasatospora sp. NBC_01246 TaxID=2903570 RepID=UPI002E332AFF|nr:hypothetical protein [Kitasatospora sp. NBC_01246]
MLLVDGFNLLWAGTFGFPAPIHSRDKTRELTGLFAFFPLLRAAIRDDLDVTEPEVLVVFDGEHGSAERAATDQEYKANREATPEALKPLQFLTPVKDGLDAHGIRWIEVDDTEADDVIATLATRAADSRPALIMSRPGLKLLIGVRRCGGPCEGRRHGRRAGCPDPLLRPPLLAPWNCARGRRWPGGGCV